MTSRHQPEQAEPRSIQLLRTLRQREAVDPSHPSLPVIRSLIGLTISGLSAALQGTG